MRGVAERRRKDRFSSAVPLAAVALPVLLLSSLVLLAGLMIWQNYNAAVSAAEVRAQSSAHVVAAHTEWMIEASDQALRRIDAALDGAASPTTTFVNDLTQAVGDLPEGFQYSVYGPDGTLRFSSFPQAHQINVSDRDYFRQLVAGREVVISPMLDERLSGQKVFVIARRLSRDGKFAGGASIAIPESRMAEFWQTLDLGPYSSVSIVLTDGWLVARFPQIEKTINLSDSPLFTLLKTAPSGFYHSANSPADHLSRIVGYWRVENWPLIATAGIERGQALAVFRSNLISGLLLGVPMLFLLAAGSVVFSRLVNADMRTRAALETALERNQFLFREIHHRVKNNLQAVSALVRLQPLPAETRADMARRIAAMVAVHEQIYRSDQFDTVEVGPYAERLVREIAAAYDGKAELHISMQPLRVGRDQAMPLGLVINEVVSNAFKHSFRDRSDGRLTVKLEAQEGGKAQLTIADNGPGFEPEGVAKGMGSRLISGFVEQIGGAYRIEKAGGTRFVMTFPISEPQPAA